MTLDALIMIAGAFVVVVPFFGFPTDLLKALLFVAGVVVIGLGIVVRRKEGERQTKERLASQTQESRI